MNMKLTDIKIYDNYLRTKPAEKKMEECRNYWDKHKKQDRFLVVNKEGFLIDGYVQYLVLKENNIDEVDIQISNKKRNKWKRIKKETYRNQRTTYIYGRHPGDEKKKVYVWRVPFGEKWDDFRNKIEPEDFIFCYSKQRIAPVEIVKIETLDECPVIYPVNKVARRTIVKEE